MRMMRLRSWKMTWLIRIFTSKGTKMMRRDTIYERLMERLCVDLDVFIVGERVAFVSFIERCMLKKNYLLEVACVLELWFPSFKMYISFCSNLVGFDRL